MNLKRAASCIFAVATLALSACAIPYKPPQQGPIAQLQLRSEIVQSRSALLYTDGQCSHPKYTSTDPKNPWMAVEADKPIWLKQSYNTVGLPFGRYCESLVTFTPQQDQSYAVEFTLSPAGCESRVYRLEASGSQLPEISASTFSNPKCRTW